MTRIHFIYFAAGLLGVALATSAVAQQSQGDFPRQRTAPTSCQEVDWNANMQDKHPRLISACQEVVTVDGESWARFHAKFDKIEQDGTVVFNVQDRRDRPVEEMKLVPSEGQVAYIDGRATPFNELSSDQVISLYVPEGEYGFATEAGDPPTRIATANPERSQANERASTQRESRSGVLPATASSLPWFALGGFFLMLAGLTLTMRRLK